MDAAALYELRIITAKKPDAKKPYHLQMTLQGGGRKGETKPRTSGNRQVWLGPNELVAGQWCNATSSNREGDTFYFEVMLLDLVVT